MGDKKHNNELFLKRNTERISRERATLKIWKVWENLADSDNEDVSKEKVDLSDLPGGYEDNDTDNFQSTTYM